MTLQVAELMTPVGPLTVATEAGVVVASGFGGGDDLLDRLAARRRAPSETGLAAAPAAGELVSVAKSVPPSQLPGGIAAAVAAYFAGDVDSLSSVPVSQSGTPLQDGVWQVLRLIPAGQTWSYSQLAAAIGRPAAVRAVGQACGANLVAPFVPCHRAVRSDGALGGYAYGVEVKQWLLTHEGAVQPVG